MIAATAELGGALRVRVLLHLLGVPLTASWRLMTLLAIVVGLPVSAVAALFLVVGLRDEALVLFLAAILFIGSHYVHELAHAAVYQVLGPRAFGLNAMVPDGGWRHATIVRQPVPARSDVLVSAAGPLAGLLCGLPLLGAATLSWLALPYTLLFAFHVVSVAPWSADGRAIADARSESRAARR